MTYQPIATGPGRLPVLDHARTVALIAMAIYHTTYDLEMFGWITPGTATSGGWAIFARCVAGTFLGLAGFSLWLAHGRGIRWPSYLKRLAMIGAAAALVTIGSWLALPQYFIFFGILHCIAFCSVVGLMALRLHPALTALAALAIAAAPQFLRTGAFDGPWLSWTGLATIPPASIDFVPPFPWLGAFVAGLALAQILDRTGVLDRMRATGPQTRLSRALGWPGRHSLIIYLVHQPIIVGLMYVFTVYIYQPLF